MRAKWRALKSGCCSVLKKCLTGATVLEMDVKSLGPYRKCPGVTQGEAEAPQRSAGALSIRAFEGSRWHHAGPSCYGF